MTLSLFGQLCYPVLEHSMTEPRTSCTLGICLTTGLYIQPQDHICILNKCLGYGYAIG